MTKHAKKSDHLQLVDLPKTTPWRSRSRCWEPLRTSSRSFFELCIDAGQQVLASMMEQDREDLCGPRWKRDPDREAGTGRDDEERGHARAVVASRSRGLGSGARRAEEVELPSFRLRREPGSARPPHVEGGGLRRLDSEVRAQSRSAARGDRRTIGLEELGVASLRRDDDEADDDLADDAARRSSLPDRDDRRDPPGRPSGPDRSGHRQRGEEAGSGPSRRRHGERPRREGAASRPRRARSRPGARPAVRHRRREGPALCDPERSSGTGESSSAASSTSSATSWDTCPRGCTRA